MKPLSARPGTRSLAMRQLGLLRRMIEDISGELEQQPLLNRLVERACRLIDADDGTIALYVPERKIMRTAAIYRMPDSELGAEMRAGEGLAGLVLERNAPVHCRYGDLPRPTSGEPDDNDVIGMPIRAGDRLIGVFGIGAWPPRRLQRSDRATLALFARHAAIAIDNARRYEMEQRRTARFKLIGEVAAIIVQGSSLDDILAQAADAIHEVLEYPNVDLPLVDPDDPTTLIVRHRGGDYKRLIRHEDRLPIDSGIMGCAVRERSVQRVDNVAADPRYVTPPGVPVARAELAVPILLGGQVLGVVNVEGERPFDDLDIECLRIIADHLAVAIGNARLHQRARLAAVLAERERLAHDLHDSVTQILSSISLLSQSLPMAWQREPAEGQRRAERVQQLTQLALGEMRSLLHELSSPPHESSAPVPGPVELDRLGRLGLASALAEVIEAMTPDSIELVYSAEHYQPQRLSHEQGLFLIAREAVSNAIRHGRPRHLTVVLTIDGDQAVLKVVDDGVGLPVPRPNGIGLGSMRARCEALGGRLSLRGRPGGGVLVMARLPRDDR